MNKTQHFSLLSICSKQKTYITYKFSGNIFVYLLFIPIIPYYILRLERKNLSEKKIYKAVVKYFKLLFKLLLNTKHNFNY